MADTNNDKDRIADAVEQFNEAEEHWSDARSQMLADLKFSRLGEQWDEQIAEDRTQAQRPVLTINKMPSFARQVVNEARQNKPAIKVAPADDKADVHTAEVMNGLIRNIEYTSNAEVAYDTALENAVYCGVGYFRIGVDYSHYDQFDLDIHIERMSNSLSVVPDIGTEACDASDWNRCFVTDLMLRDEFVTKYPEADPVDWSADFSDNWRTKEDVRVAERWERTEVDTVLLQLSDGTVLLEDQYLKHQAIFEAAGLQVVKQRPTTTHTVKQEILTASDILETVEWAGRYIPICPVYGEEFTVDGKRYFKSMFHDAKDSQRMFNYWRTASTELVALAPKAPYVGAVGQFATDGENWANANIDNLAYLEYDVIDGAPPPQRQSPPQIPVGALQETQSADDDMKSIIGVHNQSLGDRSGANISGKAVEEWRSGSEISNFHFQDNLSRGMRYAGRVLLDLIPKVYNEERVIRVMGWDDKVENVPLKREYEKEGQTRIHDFSKGKYDLTVHVGASFTTKRKEAVDSLLKMVSAAPEVMAITGDLIAKNMDWEGSDEIAKRLHAMLPPNILALEEMDDVPEEARSFIVAAQEQVKQMEGTIEQGQQVMQQMKQELDKQELKLLSKEGEVAVKSRKLEVDVQIAHIKEEGDLKIEELKGLLKEQYTMLEYKISQLVGFDNTQVHI